MLSQQRSGQKERHTLCNNNKHSHERNREYWLAKVGRVLKVDSSAFHWNCWHRELCLEALYTVAGRITIPEDVHILSLVPGIATLHRKGEFTSLIS